jgi:DNA-binding GntR family transcriptional regulator
VGNRRVEKDAAGDGGVSLVDRVHAAVRESILSGEYQPGSRLLAAKLAAENGVSSIPVREALRRLETERLIEVERNRGATVTPISVEDLLDIYETRIVIECYSLRRAYPKLDRAILANASRELKAMTGLLRSGKSGRAYEHHRAFHFALYEPAGSAWSMHVIGQLWVGAERYLRLSAGLRDTPEQFAAEHEAVLAAVRAGDEDAAVERLEQHLRRTADLLQRAYGDGHAPRTVAEPRNATSA